MSPTPTGAIVRPFASTYAPAYRLKGVEILPSLATQQHQAYARALERAGLQVETVPADDAFYDCVFVEDTAIVWDRRVLITSMANQDREGEQQAVREYLGRTHQISGLPAGAFLDGGDVMHADAITYVGLSSRTNAAGAEALSAFMKGSGRPVITVEVANVLHLKTAMTYLGNGTALTAEGCVDVERLRDLSVMKAAPGEEGAANCLRIADALLIPAGYSATERTLRAFAARHHVDVVVLDISEFEKGGGSLSCLSLMWREGPEG